MTGSMPGKAASTVETCVFGSAPKSVAAPENSFALRGHLGMHFEADDDLPRAGAAFDQIRHSTTPSTNPCGDSFGSLSGDGQVASALQSDRQTRSADRLAIERRKPSTGSDPLRQRIGRWIRVRSAELECQHAILGALERLPIQAVPGSATPSGDAAKTAQLHRRRSFPKAISSRVQCGPDRRAGTR